MLWIIVSASLFITIIENDNRAGEWRKLKDNHRLDPSDYVRLASSGGSSVFHHSPSTYGNRVGEWRDLKGNLRQFQAKVTGGLKDNLRHFRAERSGGGEVVEYERDSGRHRLSWIIASVSLFIIIIKSDNRAKWSGGGEVVEFGRWSGKSSALGIIVLTTLSNIIALEACSRWKENISDG